MKYILDASTALKWELPEQDSDKALRLRDEFKQSIHELISPDIFALEVANSLARQERNGLIANGQAAHHLATILLDCPKLEPHFSLLQRALAIATAARHGVYDCLYVALAEREGCELVTADDKMVKYLGPTFPFIKALSGFPS
jgi:predicted nucleic acid-binding protein